MRKLTQKLRHKGFFGYAEYDVDGNIFTGEVKGIRSVITFQGRTPEELENSFRESIELFLEMCRDDGIEPKKPYSRRFNIRLTPELHRILVIKAAEERKSLNELVVETMQKSI